MSFKTFCDICNKEVEQGVTVRGFALDIKNYCNKCWANKKNWHEIHTIKSEE